MKLSKDDRKKYPKFYHYVRYSMPTVVSVGVIVNNLRTYGSLSATQSRHALAWDNEPLIVITPLYGGQCGGGGAANGCFRPSSPNQIEIAEERVIEFVNGQPGALDVTSSGKKVYVVGTTILHELCHWGRNLNGLGTDYNGEEAGIAFEVATYGRNTG